MLTEKLLFKCFKYGEYGLMYGNSLHNVISLHKDKFKKETVKQKTQIIIFK